MSHLLHSRHARRRLLGGISALILAAALLPATASAQVREVDSEGRVTLTTAQRSWNAGIAATSLVPPATVRTGELDEAAITLRGNSVAARAAANGATTELVRDDPAPAIWPARVAIRADMIDAEAARLIVARQTILGSPVLAEASGSAASIAAGPVERSTLAIAANNAVSEARGNDHLGSLSTDGSGGGIAVQQASDGSQVRAALSGVTMLQAGSATDSVLSVQGNRQQAGAFANSAESILAASGSVAADMGAGPTSFVDSAGTISARGGVVSVLSQTAGGPTIVDAGHAFPSGSLLYVDAASASQLAVDTNGLDATAAGNRASNALRFNGVRIEGPGSVASAVTAQRLDGDVRGNATGGHQLHVAGVLEDSWLSASGNSVRASVTGNIADTAVQLDAATIATFGLPGGPVGSALLAENGDRSTTGAFAAHSDQHSGRITIHAAALLSGVTVSLDGAVDRSTITASDNVQSARAIINDAGTRLTIASPTFASSADLLAFQSSDAQVSATAGGGEDLAGVTVAPLGPIGNAQISLRDNSVLTTSIGNRTANRLELAATQVADGGDHDLARVGALGDIDGASATLALSSVQTSGNADDPRVIRSFADGRFAVTGDVAISDSLIRIQGNSQYAAAVANTAENSLTASTSTLGDASTALASSQTGSGIVRAISTARFVAPWTVERSTVSIDDNANQASATMNEAVNRLSVQTNGGIVTPMRADGNALGEAHAEGRNILVSTQFATGRGEATASTGLVGSTGDDGRLGLAESDFRITGNSALAQASGNRASNDAVLTGTSGGIASSQMNAAGVSATARTALFLEVPNADQQIISSRIGIEDNRAAALARGNLVENHIAAADIPGNGIAWSEAGRLPTSAIAPIALVSAQTNRGVVIAVAEDRGSAMPLNLSNAPVDRSRLTISGNSTAATAYGNGAVNSVTLAPGQMPGVALASSQYNHAPVQAHAMGGTAGLSAGGVVRSNLTIANNSITASATGNIVTNLIGTPR